MKDEHKICGFNKAQSLDYRGMTSFIFLRIYLVHSLWLLTENGCSRSTDLRAEKYKELCRVYFHSFITLSHRKIEGFVDGLLQYTSKSHSSVHK